MKKTSLSFDRGMGRVLLERRRPDILVAAELAKPRPNTKKIQKVLNQATQGSFAIRHVLTDYLCSPTYNIENRSKTFIDVAGDVDWSHLDLFRQTSDRFFRFVADLVANKNMFATIMSEYPQIIPKITSILLTTPQLDNPHYAAAITGLFSYLDALALPQATKNAIAIYNIFDSYQQLAIAISAYFPDIWNSIVACKKKSYFLQASIALIDFHIHGATTKTFNWIIRGLSGLSQENIELFPAIIYVLQDIIPNIKLDKIDILFWGLLEAFSKYALLGHNFSITLFEYLTKIFSYIIDISPNKAETAYNILKYNTKIKYTRERKGSWSPFVANVIYCSLRDKVDQQLANGILDYIEEIIKIKPTKVDIRYINLALRTLLYRYETQSDWQYIMPVCQKRKELLFSLLVHRPDIKDFFILRSLVGLLIAIDPERALSGPIESFLITC